MRTPVSLLITALLSTFAGLGTAKADANSMLLVTCEPGVPYFSFETLIVETDSDMGPSVGGNGLLPLRAMIDRPIECMVGKYKVQAILTEFYPANAKRAIQAAHIVITINGKPASELHTTHRLDLYDGRARVEINAYVMKQCQSASNDWAIERFPPDRKGDAWHSLVCSRIFLAGKW